MDNTDYNFQYTPLTGRLPGNSFVKQTEKAINELAGIVNEGSAQVEVITNLANTANDNSEEALEKANEALETSGRVYITLPNLDDADDYFDSQLYYFANEYSANLPVQDTGFLEVKTNDTKTAAEQVFIADTTGLCYFRHGDITGTEVGDETVYSVTWEIWSSALASETYVQTEVNIGINSANDYTDNKVSGYLPLSGGTINGDLSFTGGSRKITFNNGKSYVIGFGNGVYMYGDTANKQSSFVAFTNENGSGFQINAGDGTTQKRMVGSPVGTLTWDGQPLLPVGVVQAFAGTTIPNGWLLCDGSAVSRTTYANLYACIGDTYGAGDGSTTFNLPNLIDKFVEGSATAGTEKSAGLPNITGSLNASSNFLWKGGGSAGSVSGAFKDLGISSSDWAGNTQESGNSYWGFKFDASKSNSIYGNSTTVQPPALTMKYIIKY